MPIYEYDYSTWPPRRKSDEEIQDWAHTVFAGPASHSNAPVGSMPGDAFTDLFTYGEKAQDMWEGLKSGASKSGIGSYAKAIGPAFDAFLDPSLDLPEQGTAAGRMPMGTTEFWDRAAAGIEAYKGATTEHKQQVGFMDITDDSGRGNACLITPRQNCKGVVVGNQIHVGLFDPGKAVDRRTVKHDFAIKGFSDLAARNRNILQEAVNITKLYSEEIDILLFDNFENVLFSHGLHSFTVFFKIKNVWLACAK